MILDRLLRFSDAQDLGQVQGDYASTDVIDFGLGTPTNPAIPSNADGGGVRDMGIGDTPALKLLVQIIEAFTSGGAATLTVALQGAPDDGAGAPGAYETYWQSEAYALAELAIAGGRLMNIDWPRPPQGKPVYRFYRLLYTIGGADTTAGTISAYVVLDRDDQMYNGENNAIIGGYRAGLNVAN